jgi:hypothetical protein
VDLPTGTESPRRVKLGWCRFVAPLPLLGILKIVEIAAAFRPKKFH